MSRGRREDEDSAEKVAFNAPFRELKKLVRPVLPPPAAKATRPTLVGKVPPGDPADEADLFRQAVEGAVPLPPDERRRVALPPSSSAAPVSEDAEALAELFDLVSGSGEFHVSDTDEYIEGTVVGLDPRMLYKLRAGEFSYQAHLDLHGMTSVEAKTAVRQFVLRALRAGHRCVLLVHGRGRNSPDQRPVLKDGLRGWLTRGELSRVVLAFCSARACDGGAGATYVLLRRARRQKKPFRTLVGAKS